LASDEQFRRFCQVIGNDRVGADSRFTTNRDRQAHRHQLTAEIEHALAARTTADWLLELKEAGIPAGPIYDLGQAFADPVVAEREMKIDVRHPSAGTISVVGAPWKLDDASLPVRRPPPRLGEHTAEVLREVAGYDDERTSRLAG